MLQRLKSMPDNDFKNIIFLGFADNKVPEFKEVKSKDWILFGEDNLFPESLLYLFNKSSNHNAIINGKVSYIIGQGLPIDNRLRNVNRNGESFNKVLRKFASDIELFGGAYFQVIWKMGGGCEISHMPFQHIRKGKDDGWWYCKNWKQPKDRVHLQDFDMNNRVGAQIFHYKEYRPGCDIYPLPGYFGALNDIETDVEISKYNLSVIKNGMFSSKMIVFNNGIPTDEQKRDIEKDFKKKFAGSENSGNFMLVFNSDPTKAPTVQDLSTTDLDKLFDQLNKTTQAEIFSGHNVTSPMLFGIMEQGKLGGRNELQDAYEIFKNTYVNFKQQALEEIIQVFLPLFGVAEQMKFVPVDPIGFRVTDDKVADLVPKEWLYEKLGIDITKYPSVAPTAPVAPVKAVNDNIKNLTGRQHQQLLRIIRQFGQGKISKEQATTLLRTGLGLEDTEIETMLKQDEFSADELGEEIVADMFSEVGEVRDGFTVVKSYQTFGKDEFADIKQTDSDILDLIRKDKRITPDVIGKTLKLDPSYVAKRIQGLQESGVLTKSVSTIGIDSIIENVINPEMIDTRVPAETVDIYIKYSYEAKPGLKPIIDTTRPFCKRLIELDRLYTRSEIESISQRVGFSVWDRKGGFWGSSPECRHRWVRNIVIKKK